VARGKLSEETSSGVSVADDRAVLRLRRRSPFSLPIFWRYDRAVAGSQVVGFDPVGWVDLLVGTTFFDDTFRFLVSTNRS
jgi:hypothetical protein